MENSNKISEVTEAFNLPGELKECIPYGNGHINDTYRLTCETPEGIRRYILQRMSRRIFKNPQELMENVSGVTSWLRKKIIENGGDPERETLTLLNSRENLPYFVDSTGDYWRIYLFIEGATCYEQVKDDNDFYQSAVAFGHFQRLLADYPAETLHETIKDFHNTPDRLKKFKKAVAEDVCGRAAAVQDEINFILEREELTRALYDMQKDGRLPLRVTHNDTKLNNIMIDEFDLWKIPNPKLRHYMFNYLEIITVISTIMLIRSGTEENLEKKRELWKYIKDHDIRLFHHLRNGIMGNAMNLPGRGGRKISVAAYKLSQKIVGFN